MFLDLVLLALSSQHGLSAYLLVFAVMLLAGIGAPWSQDILLLAAAGVGLQRSLDPVPLAVAAWLGVMAGDALSVWLGRHYGARWIRRPWAARFVPPPLLPVLEDKTRRAGPWLSFVTRFLPGQRGTVFFLAGALRLPWRAFLAGDGLAALVQVPLFVFGARALGWDWRRLQGPFEWADNVLTLALVVGLVVGWRWMRRSAGPA